MRKRCIIFSIKIPMIDMCVRVSWLLISSIISFRKTNSMFSFYLYNLIQVKDTVISLQLSQLLNHSIALRIKSIRRLRVAMSVD